MMYLGQWVRRSNVLTGAQWMHTRFGRGRGAELAYLSVVGYALVSVVRFLTMAFQGIGKFAEPFFQLGWSPNTYALVIMLVSGLYCIFGGMYSVVLNDVIQFGLIALAAILIAGVALVAVQRPRLLVRHGGGHIRRVGHPRLLAGVDRCLAFSAGAGPERGRFRRRLPDHQARAGRRADGILSDRSAMGFLEADPGQVPWRDAGTGAQPGLCA